MVMFCRGLLVFVEALLVAICNIAVVSAVYLYGGECFHPQKCGVGEI